MLPLRNFPELGGQHAPDYPTFNNNSKTSRFGTYSQASDDFLGWIANTEDFIIENYGKESGPYKLFQKFEQEKINGYEQDDFDQQKSIILGSLKACISIKPKRNNISKNPIIELLKNNTFWKILVITLSGTFALGLHFGSVKFDKEKLIFMKKIDN